LASALLAVAHLLWHLLLQVLKTVRYPQLGLQAGALDSFGIAGAVGATLANAGLTADLALSEALAVKLEAADLLALAASARLLPQR